MSTEVCWIRQEAQQAISNIQASVKSCDELSPAPDTPKDDVASREERSNSLCPLCARLAVSKHLIGIIGDAAGVVRVIATGTSGLSKADNTSREHSKLYWWDEVPAVLQFNPYIKSGYRAGSKPLLILCKERTECSHKTRKTTQFCFDAEDVVAAGLTRQECVGSLFHCHNETGMQAGHEGVSIVA